MSYNDITAEFINTKVNPNDTLMRFMYPNEIHWYPNKPIYTAMNPNNCLKNHTGTQMYLNHTPMSFMYPSESQSNSNEP